MKRKTKRTRTNRAHRHAGRLAYLRKKAEAKEVFLEERSVRRAINTDKAHHRLAHGDIIINDEVS